MTTFDRIVRRAEVLDASGDSRTTQHSKIQQGLWTRPVRLGARSVGWPASEVAALINARIAGETDDEIRALVIRLHRERQRLRQRRSRTSRARTLTAVPDTDTSPTT